MIYERAFSVDDVAQFFGGEYCGKNFIIHTVCSIQNPKDNALGFIQKSYHEELSRLPVLWLTLEPPKLPVDFLGAYIVTSNPRLAYAKVVQEFFVPKQATTVIAPSAIIGRCVVIGQRVVIGAGTVIGDNVHIGDDTIINCNVVIAANTVIGKSCYIKSGAIVGEEGFGFAFDVKRAVRIPHLGQLIIGNYVEIGANTTVARGTIDNTYIDDYVKIDDQVIIAHNCEVGANTMITGFSSLGGSVKVAQNCYFSPHSSTVPQVNIAEGATIGIGTVVFKNVKASAVLMDIRKKVNLQA